MHCHEHRRQGLYHLLEFVRSDSNDEIEMRVAGMRGEDTAKQAPFASRWINWHHGIPVSIHSPWPLAYH